MSDTYTIQEALQDNQRIYFAIGEEFGTQDCIQWPMPFRRKINMMEPRDAQRERTISRAMAKMGFKAKMFGGIAQAQRKIFWDHIDGTYDPMQPEDLRRGVVWCAWCKMIGIPTPNDIETIGETMFSMATRGMEPKQWDIMIPLSFYTGVLLCKDYAELAEFLVWFTGMEIEIGWMRYPEFTNPLKEALDRQSPKYSDMERQLEYMSPTPETVDKVRHELYICWEEKSTIVHPLIFDFAPPGSEEPRQN